ncbi:MAG: hypothetical protein Faunusvirus4_15 [Faunusvirus sp.]|jgi:hypothetical protein|uniref:Uncharacterized protein n=1 Tax=Faunusvirus sp. TaxID=2487766 RepID=A0A3G4ZXX4_9VIRU|nr:MAG: hypothetical protein Faunusvirus4_15 [Faunusvirus sp.]
MSHNRVKLKTARVTPETDMARREITHIIKNKKIDKFIGITTTCTKKCKPRNIVPIDPITLRHKKIDVCMDELMDTLKVTDCSQISDKIIDDYVINSVVFPSTGINSADVLNLFYDIHSFEDAFKWVKANEHVPRATVKRILECAWTEYGDDVKSIIQDIVEFFIYYAKKWMGKSLIKIYGEKKINDLFINESEFTKIIEGSIDVFLKNYTKNNKFLYVSATLEKIIKHNIEVYFQILEKAVKSTS